MPKEKIALVTGCSTGIGYITSLTFARNEFYTYTTMCNLDKSSNIKFFVVDYRELWVVY